MRRYILRIPFCIIGEDCQTRKVLGNFCFCFGGGLISSHTDHPNVVHRFAHFLSDPAKIAFFRGLCKFLNFQDFSQNDEIPAGGA